MPKLVQKHHAPERPRDADSVELDTAVHTLVAWQDLFAKLWAGDTVTTAAKRLL